MAELQEENRALRARVAELEANHEAVVAALGGELERCKANAAAWAEDVRRLRDALAAIENVFEERAHGLSTWAELWCIAEEMCEKASDARKRAGVEP